MKDTDFEPDCPYPSLS